MIKTITLGCRFNFYESEVAKSIVNKLSSQSNVVIINTCSVTSEAERQSKQIVRKCIRENEDGAKIIVTGCAARTALEYFKNLDGIHKIIQNDKKDDIETYSDLFVDGTNINLSNHDFVDGMFDGRVRAFLQIQNGCNNHCSFCIVPHTRGKSRSLPLFETLSKVENFMKRGFKEVVLSGIDITSYSHEGTKLTDVLLGIINNFPEIKRIRISSIDPHGITGELFNLLAHEDRIMPHIHLSIQSGDNDVLKMMRRRHSREDVIDFCKSLKSIRKDIVFGADFIAGFPGETDEMHKNTERLIEEAKITMLHVFPYSPRPGTLANSFVALPQNIVRDRAKRLRELGNTAFKYLIKSFVGKNINFIVEKIDDNNCIYGKTDAFIPVKTKGNHNIGDVVSNETATAADGKFLIV